MSEHFNTSLAEFDPEVANAVAAELHRQQSTLEMIASENFTPVSVLQAQGSVLTNKYAEGYPGRRYYGGCENVDVIERLAIERVKALFGAGFANVQPHSGAQANACAMFALLQPGDTILGLDLAHGGHLTHGMRINFSGKLYNVVPYHVSDSDGRVDMAEVERLATEHRPKLIIAGWSAYPRQLDFAEFRRIADTVDAKLMVDMAHFAGHDQLRSMLQREPLDLGHVDAEVLLVHVVGNDVVQLAGEVDPHPVGEVTPVREVEAEDRVARVEEGEHRGGVGLCTRVGLHVGGLGAEELLDPVDRQLLDDVDVFAAAVVAAARVALGVLVGQHRALGLHHGDGREVLRRDHLEGVLLAIQLRRYGGVNLRVGVRDVEVERGGHGYS